MRHLEAAAAVLSLLLAPGAARADYVISTDPPPPLRSGWTFEAGIGLADFHVEDLDEVALAGPSFGIGTYTSPTTALTVRAASVTYFESGQSLTMTFIGPALQYWITPHVWAAGGFGVGLAWSRSDGNTESNGGLGLDGRLGYTFNPDARHTFDASLEITPTFIDDVQVTGIAVLLGYQLN